MPCCLISPGRSTVSINEALYVHAGDYRGIIAKHGGNAHRLLVIGHNPAVHETALTLTGSGDDELRRALAARFPTCGLAVIALADDWASIQPLSGQLVAFRQPRDLSGA